MGDITDFFTSASKTKVSPTKSSITVFPSATGGAETDTGVSLSVPNNHYYIITFQLSAGNPVTATAKLYEGATLKQTFTVTTGNVDEVSTMFQNTSGSTQTVKLTLASSNATAGTSAVYMASLIEGVKIIRLSSVSSSVEDNFWAFVTSIDYAFSGQKTNSTITGYLYGDGSMGQVTNSNTIVSVTYPDNGHFVPVLKWYCEQTAFVGAFIAYDWAGKVVQV